MLSNHSTHQATPYRVRNNSIFRFKKSVALWLGLSLLVWGSHPTPARADAFGGEVILLTNHIQTKRDAPVKYYTRKLDKRGQHVITPGLEGFYEWSLDRPWKSFSAIRFSAGYFEDTIRNHFGYLGLMGRTLLTDPGDFEVGFGIGPGLIFRETWRNLPGYEPDNPLDESDHFLPGYEYKVIPVGEVDLLWRLSARLQFAWSIVPGIPYVIQHAFGVRYQL